MIAEIMTAPEVEARLQHYLEEGTRLKCPGGVQLLAVTESLSGILYHTKSVRPVLDKPQRAERTRSSLSQGAVHTSAPEGSAGAPGLLQTESILAGNSVSSLLGEETLSVCEDIGKIV